MFSLAGGDDIGLRPPFAASGILALDPQTKAPRHIAKIKAHPRPSGPILRILYR